MHLCRTSEKKGGTLNHSQNSDMLWGVFLDDDVLDRCGAIKPTLQQPLSGLLKPARVRDLILNFAQALKLLRNVCRVVAGAPWLLFWIRALTSSGILEQLDMNLKEVPDSERQTLWPGFETRSRAGGRGHFPHLRA